ncbi:WGR domain-containing protein [Rhodoplanes serenus]|uniref:WGR domain-containing protein n=1 Tax=Rhodoplanes serenus TaxID=200615 RepID=A0A9X5ATM8_9BRAD|nr:WGR domain-containing protein [Rhodoplanes serenus]
MRKLHLTRIDPTKNMARFYICDIQPDLFGDWTLIREWGRIGRPGTVRTTTYSTACEAEAAYERQRLFKQRRGYASPQ